MNDQSDVFFLPFLLLTLHIEVNEKNKICNGNICKLIRKLIFIFIIIDNFSNLLIDIIITLQLNSSNHQSINNHFQKVLKTFSK